MDREEIWQVIDEQRASFADMLESLSDIEWTYPSLCDAWTVRDVAAHVSYAPYASVGEVLKGFVKARGSFNRMVRDLSIDAARRTSTEDMIAMLRQAVGYHRLAPGQKLKDCLMDIIVHGQDVALPLGRQRPIPLEPAVVAADHMWQMGFPFHTQKRLRGMRLVATDVDWSVGEGAEVRGPIGALLVLLTGRTATVPQLTGDGVPALLAT
ncbi:hypothetical protein Lesp02_38090 [Lentzea sp. NBRC 105346]|uniref:maleylpyruvate isomerase family mycothiol-dependent enzyme n=1 Tax=Lentzea sp. NBRC 105346 TaxID=3032205 RepID=UPI0024A442F9|nr:maleylpyruvate isomerase family mycothiol-dependent enzyme [Lentzea sp. NBRC 105346]GLZ31621.1 hypothetical protein Lesp02_38090 [Lentzea sp. NBRC 105346]